MGEGLDLTTSQPGILTSTMRPDGHCQCRRRHQLGPPHVKAKSPPPPPNSTAPPPQVFAVHRADHRQYEAARDDSTFGVGCGRGLSLTTSQPRPTVATDHDHHEARRSSPSPVPSSSSAQPPFSCPGPPPPPTDPEPAGDPPARVSARAGVRFAQCIHGDAPGEHHLDWPVFRRRTGERAGASRTSRSASPRRPTHPPTLHSPTLAHPLTSPRAAHPPT